MLRIALAAPLLLLSLLGAAKANFEDGLQAYYRMDFEGALAALEPLAEADHVQAQYQLGIMFYRGEGVLQNHETAFHWFQRAARNGDPDAQFNLGLMYANGTGVAQDYLQAHIWFSLAARAYARGEREGAERKDWAIRDPRLAARNRDWAAAKLTSDQIAEARRQIGNWRP